MRYLALDLGDKRTGVAVGDSITGIVTPLDVLEISSDDAVVDAVGQLVEQHRPDAIVLGLPLNMDGSEGDRAKRTRAFGERLSKHVDIDIHYQDERLTSFAAEQHLSGSGLTRGEKKRRRDALAAVEILNDFLESNAG